MPGHSNTGGGPALRPPPVILQVLPALVAGGVERGTVDVAAAIAAEAVVPGVNGHRSEKIQASKNA